MGVKRSGFTDSDDGLDNSYPVVLEQDPMMVRIGNHTV
jgi:hypothetical protein